MTEHDTASNGAAANGSPTNGSADNRRHFLVDINTVFSLFGKRYFLIFYFGRHLHPRQRAQLVNQRTAANWLVILVALVMLAGFAYGIIELMMWRMNGAGMPEGAGSFTALPLHVPYS